MAAHLQYIHRYLLARLYQLASERQAVAPIIALTSENGKAIAVGQMLLHPLKKQVGSALHQAPRRNLVRANGISVELL